MIWAITAAVVVVVVAVPVGYLLISRRRPRSARPLDRSRPSGGAVPSVRITITELTRGATVCILALGAVGVLGSALSAASRIESANQVGPAERANVLVAQQLTISRVALRSYELTGQSAVLDPARTASPTIRTALSTLDKTLGSGVPVSGQVAEQHRLTVEFLTDDLDPAVAGGGATADPTATDQLVTRIMALNNQIAAWTSGRRAFLTTFSVASAVITGVLVVLAAATGLLVGLRPARKALAGIAPPLEDLERMVRRLQAQDFSARADPTAGVLEIRDVAGALNELAAGQERADERAAEELRLTSLERDWGSALHSLTEVDEILQAILSPLCHGLHAPVGWIRVFPGTTDLPGESVGLMHPEMPGRRTAPVELISIAQRLATQTWRLQQSLVIYRDDADTATLVPPDVRETVLGIMEPLKVASMVFAPLGMRETCLGYLTLSRAGQDPAWSPSEIRAINRMAREIGLAIGQARSFAREQRLVGELQALDLQKNAFVSMVSHELRTPLASVIGHLEIIRNGDLGPVEPRINRSLGAVERNTRRLTTLIEDLLLLSRIEETSRPPVRKPVRLGALAAESVQMVAPMADRARIEVRVVAPADLPVVSGDANELERVFDNLLSNAIKFSPRGGRVEVELAAAAGGREVELTVRDEGIGISASDQRQLFTRFFRSTNPAAESIPGTGLGLAICKLIVERNGGRIGVESELGRGTTMRVTFPAEVAGVPTGTPAPATAVRSASAPLGD